MCLVIVRARGQSRTFSQSAARIFFRRCCDCPRMPVLSETKHLAAGSVFPPTTKDVLRLYSMRYCPYAQRTRLVLLHKDIPHEVINVNLKSKPDWFLQRNPLGLVPTLELNDKVVYESPICNEWLDEVYPDKKLGPSDPYAKAQWKMLAERFAKSISSYYKVIMGKTDEDRQQGIKDLRVGLAVAETALVGPYFGGNNIALVDFHFWPWFERLCLLRNFGFELSADEFPRLAAWVGRMSQQSAVQAARLTEQQHADFFKGYSSGAPVYDPED